MGRPSLFISLCVLLMHVLQPMDQVSQVNNGMQWGEIIHHSLQQFSKIKNEKVHFPIKRDAVHINTRGTTTA